MSNFFSPTPPQHRSSSVRAILDASAHAGHGVYLGHQRDGWCFVKPEQSVMILGPPRSGKTSSLIIPNIMASNGPVVSTSTKSDVLDATVGARSRLGTCYVFDPTESMERNAGTVPLQWSPLQSCTTWLRHRSYTTTLRPQRCTTRLPLRFTTRRNRQRSIPLRNRQPLIRKRSRRAIILKENRQSNLGSISDLQPLGIGRL